MEGEINQSGGNGIIVEPVNISMVKLYIWKMKEIDGRKYTGGITMEQEHPKKHAINKPQWAIPFRNRFCWLGQAIETQSTDDEIINIKGIWNIPIMPQKPQRTRK